MISDRDKFCIAFCIEVLLNKYIYKSPVHYIDEKVSTACKIVKVKMNN